MRERIDLNRAGKDQLLTIDGVDDELASRIVAHRKAHGAFKTLDELDRLGPMPPDAAEALRRVGFVEPDPGAEARRRADGFALRSPAFADGETIPRRHTCDGDNLAPPLEWSGAPPDTKSFVLVVEDPDAPGGTFRHWAVYDIAAGRDRLPEGATQGAPTERLGVGYNDFESAHYGGPCPPQGHGMHHYRFRLAALSVPTIQVPERPSAADVWNAARPHVIAEAELTGTYGR